MPLKYEDYSRQVSAAKLAQEVDAMNGGAEKHLVAIAKELMDWEEVAPELDVLPRDVRDIRESNAAPATKRCDLLRVWKKNTNQATYAKLLKVCVDTSNKDSADKIVELLKATPEPPVDSSPPPDNPPPVENNPPPVEDNPPPAANSNEQPKYDKDEQKKLFRANRPGHPPSLDSPEHKELDEFKNKVKIILQTVNENEYQAAVTFMKPPSKNFEKSVVFPSAGSVVGYFGQHPVALIQTDVGANVGDYVDDALKIFKSAKFVIGVGVGYAFNRDKYKFGDILVSKKISDLRNWKFDSKGEIINRGEIVDINKDLHKLFCKNLSFDDDFVVAKPDGRVSKVDAGTYASCAVLMDNKEMRDKFAKAVPEVIGGEMEGGELMQFQKKREVEGVIIIKGVVDYGDGLKEKGWQFTAAMAALTYTKDKLADLPA